MKKEKKGLGPVEYKRYIDADTGEIHEVPVILHKNIQNKDFEMIFYGHLLDVLNDLGNKKIKVLQYIIKNREKINNTFIGTIREIAIALDISHMTVSNTLTLLEDREVIKRRIGIIYINADLISDGRFRDRIMHLYQSVDEEEQTPEMKKAKIEREIKRKEAELRELETMKKQIVIIPKNQTDLFKDNKKQKQ